MPTQRWARVCAQALSPASGWVVERYAWRQNRCRLLLPIRQIHCPALSESRRQIWVVAGSPRIRASEPDGTCPKTIPASQFSLTCRTVTDAPSWPTCFTSKSAQTDGVGGSRIGTQIHRGPQGSGHRQRQEAEQARSQQPSEHLSAHASLFPALPSGGPRRYRSHPEHHPFRLFAPWPSVCGTLQQPSCFWAKRGSL
jgi:hypothetical protein